MAQHIVGHFEKVRALACGARVLVVGGVRDGSASRLTFHDASSHKAVATAEIPAHVLGLVLAGETVVAACSDGQLRLYKSATGEALRSFAAHEGAVNAVAASADGARVVSAGADGHLRVFTVATGKREHDWALSEMPLRAAAFDPTGETVAGAGDDGTVRVVTIASGEVRAMPGHEGPVLSLAYTPRDGRLVSGGDDGLIRLWFLVGDVESEVRGQGDDGHKGPVNALLFLPTPKAKPGEDQGDRFLSVGGDGKAKFWRLEDRRKPRTIDVQGGGEPAFAVAFFKQTKGEQIGQLFIGGERRDLDVVAVDASGAPGEQRVDHDGYYALRDALGSGARPAREAAVRDLAALSEPEALDMVVKALNTDRYTEVRELAAREIGRHKRVKARPALVQALSNANVQVHTAAYEALVALEPSSSVSAQRAALASNQADLHLRALADLVPQHRASPLTAGLVAGAMANANANVRLAALEAHINLLDAVSTESLELALASKHADLRIEALVRIALGHKLDHPRLAPLVAQALDDSDAGVRRTAFVIGVLARPVLAARLSKRDEDFQRAVRDVSRTAATAQLPLAARLASTVPDDAAISAARQRLGATVSADTALGEDDLGPLLAAMACRTPDTAMRGARGLAELGDTRALGALLQLSREPDKTIRREGAKALQTLDDPRAKKRLVWMLDDADADVRTAAFAAYQELERDPLELAEAALRSSQKDIRVQGLSLLVKQADRRAPAHEALLGDALEDESADVRAEAFRTLWSWHSKTPRPALERALGARFADLRRRAVQELETIGKDEAQGWARDLLLATIQDRDEGVAMAAFEALVKLRGKEDTTAPLAAMTTTHARLRAAGAKAVRQGSAEAVRSALMKQLTDENPEARSEALTSLDKLLPREPGPLYTALQGSHVDLKVQAAELLADRGDEQIIDTMRTLLGNKELARIVPPGANVAQLRYRAAKALATLASPRLLKYLATELLKDDDGMVREQAARGLSLASKKGDEGYLLDALGHNDVAVRSWAAEGLARLGDVRALPVLTGHLRHEHAPVRVGAILSFAALGPEGYGGMLQGLEDASREVQELVFLIVLARDLRALRRGEGPDLLTSALSSQRAEVRYAAARAIELRGSPGRYLQQLIEALLPPKPDKAAAMKDWPDEQERGRRMVALAEALASDQPELRYTAAQALRLRERPLDYFKQAEKLAKLRPASQAPTADTTPRTRDEEAVWGAGGWLRRLFREGEGAAANDQVPDAEQQRLRWLAFGAYVGLLRQSGDEEAGRVRRDTVERVVELAQSGVVGRPAALPALGRALDDSSNLVRKAAFAGLERLFPAGADEPLLMALASHSDDVARAALDELAKRGTAGRDALAQALQAPVASVRKHAFELLEGLYPKGSLEPLFLALQSDHADLRLGVLQRLAHTPDERVLGALVRALRSDHDDLRLMASELLAQRKNDQAAEVLGGFLRHENAGFVNRAREGLARLGTEQAVRVLAARLGEADNGGMRSQLLDALARTRQPSALEPIVGRFADDDEHVRESAFRAALRLATIDSRRRDEPLALRALAAAVQARDPALRRLAAEELQKGDEIGQSAVLQGLFTDRDLETRKAAVASYAKRVRKYGAPVEPLEVMVRRGARPTLLDAAEGVAIRGGASALRPLLLFARAGEDDERPRALLALGTLGDERALAELETVAQGGTEEAPVSPDMRQAAIEALGRMVGKLRDPEAKRRVLERLEQGIHDTNQDLQLAAMKALRWIGDDRSRSLLEHLMSPETSRNWRTRNEAAKLVGSLRNPASEPALLQGLRDSDNDVRSTSRKALLRLFPTERTRIELHALVSGHDDMAEPAAAYLANEGDAEALLPKLGELRGDDTGALRQRLRLGLLRRPVIAATSLARLLGAREASTRLDVAWLIGARANTQSLGDAERHQLTSALRSADEASTAAWPSVPADRRDEERNAWSTVLWALVALGHHESSVRLRTLATAAENVVPRAVRLVAAQGLEQLGKADEVPVLQAGLRDPDAAVRTTAAGALGRLAPAMALQLAQATVPFDPVSFARAASAASEPAVEAALGTDAGRRLVLPRLFGAGQGAPLAARILGAQGQDRLDLIAAAGRAGGPEAIEALRTFAFDKKQHTEAERKAAYRALRRAQRKAAKAAKASPSPQQSSQQHQETRA